MSNTKDTIAGEQKMNLTVDPEFQALIPPLTVEERQQLEANLLAEGCRDPLVIWSGHGILLDGHNRLDICRKHGIHFETTELFLIDRNDVRRWIINNQFGRRNLSPDQLSYIRGKQYQNRKHDKINNLLQNESILPKGQNVPSGNTAECLAHQHKVSPKTIKRDARYAQAVDSIAENCGAGARDVILSHNVRITKKEVIGLIRKPPAFQRTIIAKIMSGDASDLKTAMQQLKRERTESQVEACRDRIVDGWYQGDWREHMGKLADGSVSLLLTDPHYNAIENGATPGQTTHELGDVLTALYPKLAADAHLLVFCNWKSEPDTRAWIEAAGCVVRGVLIWVWDNHPSGNLVGAFTPKHERIVHAIKGDPMMAKPMGDVVVVVKDSSDRHPAEKPVELLRKLIEATTVEGALVADPFGGVASTCVAAYETGKRYWGCEIDPDYYAEGAERVCNGD